jgi:hypothetical protein
MASKHTISFNWHASRVFQFKNLRRNYLTKEDVMSRQKSGEWAKDGHTIKDLLCEPDGQLDILEKWN